MVASGALAWSEAAATVDVNTLVLLFGMMIVDAYPRLSGFFRLVTTWTLRWARTPLAALVVVTGAAGVLSALSVNDLVCLVRSPGASESGSGSPSTAGSASPSRRSRSSSAGCCSDRTSRTVRE